MVDSGFLGPIRRLFARSRAHLRWLLIAAGASLSVALTTVFAYNLLRPLLDGFAVAGPDSSGPAPLIAALDRLTRAVIQPVTGLLGSERGALLSLIVIAVAVKALATLVARYAVARFGLATLRDLRIDLYDSLLGQTQAFLRDRSTAELTSRMVADAELIRETVAERLSDLVVDTLTALAVIAYVLSLDLRLTLATLVAAPLLVAPVIHLARRLRRRTRSSQEHIAHMAELFDETLRGLRVIQVYTMEGIARSRFRRAAESHFDATLRARLVQAANAPAMEVIGAAAGAAVLAWASQRIAAGELSVGDLSAFLVGIYGAYNPVKRLNKLNLAVQQADIATGRILEVLDRPPEIAEAPQPVELISLAGGVRFTGVSFAYDAGRPLLADLDLVVPEGAHVALVGASGAGKSTIAHLLLRFWDVDAGAVTIGGHDVRDLSLASLRAAIGLVTQESLLFRQSIHDNISCGHPRGRAEVERAARAASAHDFIRALPEGYDTVIGEAGLTLSGGQRQRLAIARAMLKNAPVLILDEATSALDSESEGAVREALATLSEGRTTLTIAHRPSTVRAADRIAVLDHGRIVQQGEHRSLLDEDGPYRRLVEA